jgi:hypothetical protein
MSWKSGAPLYYDVLDKILKTNILNDAQMLMLAADIKEVFEEYDCDSIEREVLVDQIMSYYYKK